MCDQTAAQNRALSNALNATSAPGFIELDGAIDTFSLQMKIRKTCINSRKKTLQWFAYFSGFGLKLSRFGGGFFCFFGKGVMFSVLVNRCLIAGIVVPCNVPWFRARCIETYENFFRIVSGIRANINGTRRIALCGWKRTFYDSYLLNSCHTNTFSTTQPQFSFDKYWHTICRAEKRQNSLYYMLTIEGTELDCFKNVFQ